jgi:hypothetical protein
MALALTAVSSFVALCATFGLALVATRYHERTSTDAQPR